MIRGRALLQNAYAELNQRVAERTADLSQANEQLHKEVGDRIRAELELRAAHDELVHRPASSPRSARWRSASRTN
ncbi:MAG: hypothetical protein GAK41_00751 [Burkholderia gladioli]|nr:MAG: hypothetical protein GAK41_00751 [Burkholderia gladioli]